MLYSYDDQEQERCDHCGAWLSHRMVERDNEHGGTFEDIFYYCKNPKCSSNETKKRMS